MGCIVNKGQKPEEFCKVISQETGGAVGKEGTAEEDPPVKDEVKKAAEKRSGVSGDGSEGDTPIIAGAADATETLLPWQVADTTFSGGPSKTVTISNGATQFVHCGSDGCKTLEIPNGSTVEMFNSWVRVRYKGKNGFVLAKSMPLSPRPSESRQIRGRHDSVDAERRETKRKETQQVQNHQQAYVSPSKGEDRLFKIRQWIDGKPPNDIPCSVKDGEGLSDLTATNIQQNLQAIRQYNDKMRSGGAT